jgi:hypothetical protein
MSQATQEQGSGQPDLNAPGNTATTPPPGQQQASAEQGQPGSGTPAQGTGDEDKGKGSKREVLADLAEERQKRHELESTVAQQGQQLKEFLEGIGKALGIKTDSTQTPEQLQASLAEAQQASKDNQVLLGVYAAAHTLQADPTKIMDSVRVRDQLRGVDPSDTAKITEVITKAVADNPHFRLTPAGAGSGDAGAGGDSRTPAQSMNDWIRSAARGR